MKKLLFAAFAAATAGVRADEVGPGAAVTNRIGELAPVVIYGSRVDDTAESMASPVRVFEAPAIARSGARSLPELLDKAAGLQIRTLNANPLQSQVAMRGYGENSFGRVKIVIDGEEINPVDMDAPNLVRIPIESIERVEVIDGPSPVLYGDGAVAGVIVVTTDSRDSERKTSITARGGSHGTFGANVRTKGGLADEGLLYSAAYDYGRSDGFRDRAGYDTHAFVAALRKEFANGSTVGLKANYFNALYELPGSLSLEQWRRDRTQANYANDWCRQWNYGLAVDSKLRLAEDQWLYLDGAFSVKHRRASWGDYGYANEYDLYSYQLSPRYVNGRPIFGFDSKFTFGFDFRYDRYEVTDRSGWNNPHYNFGRGRYALFAEEEFGLTEWLSLVAGARGEYIDSRWERCRGLSESSSHDCMGDYELGLVCRPLDGLKTFVKGTCYHRSAFCDELSYTEDGSFLDPETGASLDLGLDWAFAEEFRFDLSGYWTVTKDEIFYNPYAVSSPWGWGGYNCNSPDRIERLGFQTGLAWLREGTAEASVRYSFVKSRFCDGQYGGETVPLVPESRVRAEVGVWICDDLEVKGGYRYVSSQVLAGDFGNEHDRLAGYSVFDVGLYYTPSWAEGWKASFVMDNLLDRDYCDFAGWSDYTGAYYYPACGRSFMFALGYSF